MPIFTRSNKNPLLRPNARHSWEHQGAFNGCIQYDQNNKRYHLVYRALSKPAEFVKGVTFDRSTVGYATSHDGLAFTKRRVLIQPELPWERYGCEDPRLGWYENQWHIFYTALRNYPYGPASIQVAVASTTNFSTFTKHHLTPFNAKAMAIFPESIQNHACVIFTLNPDIPPSSIVCAFAPKVKDFYSPQYWDWWYRKREDSTIPLLRSLADHVEVGAPPVLTPKGWLLLYSYIRNYQTHQRQFTVEAALLDRHDPRHILARTKSSLFEADRWYEKKGVVDNVAFPTGLLVEGKDVHLYYGAADTYTARASTTLQKLYQAMGV